MAPITSPSTAGQAGDDDRHDRDLIFSPIELLPNELLEVIMDELQPLSICRLRRCSMNLNRRLECFLLADRRRPWMRDRAMRWACERGLNQLIDRCIYYGCSPSTISISIDAQNFPGRRIHRGPPVPTLYLALKHGSVASFRHLLVKGAGFDLEDKRDKENGTLFRFQKPQLFVEASAVGAMVRRLCLPDRKKHASLMPTLLGDLLRAGIAPQLGREWLSRMLLLMLQSKVHKKHAMDFTRWLLVAGADPNYVYMRRGAQSMSPLSAALLHHGPEMWHYLADYGADINGDPLPVRNILPSEPFHMPLCAAVMADLFAPNIDLKAMRFCLDRGADVNHGPFVRYDWDQYPVFTRINPTYTLYQTHGRENRQITPVQLLLQRAGNWHIDGAGPTALAALKLLLDRSAYASEPTKILKDGLIHIEDESFYRTVHDHQSQWSFVILAVATTKTISKPLALPCLVKALRLLIRHGGLVSAGPLALFILPEAAADPDAGKLAEHQAMLAAWDSILVELISAIEREHDSRGSTASRRNCYLSMELRSYVFRLLDSDGRRYAHPILPQGGPIIGPLARATVRRFVEAGADVNYVPMSEHWHDGFRPRTQVPVSLVNMFLVDIIAGSGPKGRMALYQQMGLWKKDWRHYSRVSFTEDRIRFLKFLIKDYDAVVDLDFFGPWLRLEGYEGIKEEESRELASEMAEVFGGVWEREEMEPVVRSLVGASLPSFMQ